MSLPMTRSKRDVERPASGGGGKRVRPRSGESRRTDVEQSDQLLAIAERLLSERGLGRVGVEEVSAAAGVDPGAFDALIGDRDAMLLALFDRIVARLDQTISEAYRSEPIWVDALRVALFELLAFLDSSPQIARFLIVESLRGEPAMLQRRERALRALARVIEADRPDATTTAPPFGAEAVVGAAASVLHGRLLEEPVPSLGELGGPLMGILVMPFLDASAVREELSRPLPPPGWGRIKRSAHQRQLGAPSATRLRVTNRTAQVLEAIAAHPGTSDSAIASTVGIVDQGQISKLLAHLRRARLIEDDPSTTSPTSKAWRITPAGASLLEDLQSPPPHPRSPPGRND